ncbi:MAG: hemerythrin family protein [Rhodoblastus sp.]|nr:hemerythrin family protein [Rhodoblastus sp.]MCB1524927.1 hemerythrin family protein [Rhodoblastus sp.]
MDEDHARLEQAIAQAADAPEADLPALHEAIARELAAHFAREEDLMRTHDFPGLHCHLAQHKLLLEEARRPVAGGGGALRRRIAVYIAQLVESHVLTLDSITAAFIRGEFSPANFDNLRLPIEPAPR